MSRVGIWVGAAMASVVATAAAAQTPIPPAASDFAASAVQADQYEIEAAWVASTQSRDPGVRAFAQEMISDHTRAREAMRRAAQDAGTSPPPPAMSSDQASMLSALQSLTGPDFDKAYAKQQVLAHTQALAVEQSYASAGANAALRGEAQSELPVIQHHLSMAQQLAGALGSS